MDVVLGVALTVDSVRLVMVEGSGGDGDLIDQDTFDIDRGGGVESATVTEHVVNAVLGTYGVAAANGHNVERIAVTWTDDAAEDAELLIEALEEVGVSNVVAVTGCDAAETFVEQMAAAADESCAAACLIEGSQAPVAYIAVMHAGAGGIRRMRSRVVNAVDHRQLALSVRGACAECAAESDRVAVFAAGAAGVLTGMLAGELNSTLSTQVVIPQNAALAFARGAAQTNAGAQRRLHVVGARSAIASGGGVAPPAVFVPRTAKLMAIPGITAASTPAAAPTVVAPDNARQLRTLTAVVGGGVLAFVAALSMYVGSQLRDTDEQTTEAKSRPANVAPAGAAEAVAAPAAPAPEAAAPPPPAAPPAPPQLPPPPAAAVVPAAMPVMAPPPPAAPPNPLQMLAAVAGPQLAAINQGLHGGVLPGSTAPGANPLTALAPGGLPPNPAMGDPALNNAAFQVAQAVVPPVLDHADQPMNLPAVPPVTDKPINLPPLRDMIDGVRPDRQNEDAHFGVNVPKPDTPYYQPPGAAPMDAPPPVDAPPPADPPAPPLPAEAP